MTAACVAYHRPRRGATPENVARLDEAIRLKAQGLTWVQVADRLGYLDPGAPAQAAYKRRKRARELTLRGRAERVSRVDEAIRLRDAGHTWPQIADALGYDDPLSPAHSVYLRRRRARRWAMDAAATDATLCTDGQMHGCATEDTGHGDDSRTGG